MLITVDVPDQVATEFHLDAADQSRRLLEAFLLQCYAEGALSAGRVGAALGLDFQATEKFLHDHGAPPNIAPEEHAQDVAALERLIA